MHRIGGFLFASVVAATPAWTATEPVLAPAGAWVEAVAIPEPDPAAAQKPVQILLLNEQSHYGPEKHDHFFQSVTLIQAPAGLGALGTIAIPWAADQADLVIHKLHIIRDGKVVDVLANQKFTVVRREGNLEQATLDGVLTAVIQPSGLAVGDTVDLAFTVRRRPGAIDYGAENMNLFGDAVEARHVRLREIWPEGATVRWRASPQMGTPKIRKTKLGNELTFDLTGIKIPKPPADAPPRFRIPGWVQVSAYPDWQAVSRSFAPAFEKAATLPGDSPLKAEIDRIAAASPDPRQRAMAALRLVQDKIRYVALLMGEAGLTPASADETWSRKYADCKGKTVTLIALLHGLGIEAEPVLISSSFGDALPERLPQVRLFDHVIVRARIDGRSYWLDGTRVGDRQLDALASSPFGWGLPVRAAGATLEELPLAPPPLPMREASISYDATAGFAGPVPYTAEVTFRGDWAIGLQLAYAQLGKERTRENIGSFVTDVPNDDEISSYDFTMNDAAGTFTFTYRGKARMDWNSAPSSRAVRYKFSNDVISWDVDFDRPAGPFADVPHRLSFPFYVTSRETILLPKGISGFSIDGKSFDRTVGGVHIARTVSIENGKAWALSSFQRLQPELSVAEATASTAGLKEINADAAYVRSPEDYKPNQAEIDAIVNGQPTTATDYVDRGYHLLQRGELTKAIADFDKAVSLSPRWSTPWANKGITLFHKGKLDEAEVALAKAAELSDGDFVVHQGYGLIYAARDEPQKAIQSFSRSLQLDPDNSYTLVRRASAYDELGRYRDALADVDQALTVQPDDAYSLRYKARLHAELGELEEALTAVTKAAGADVYDPSLEGYRGEILLRLGRKEEANQAFAAAMARADKDLARRPGEWASITAQKVAILMVKGDHQAAIALADRGLAKQFDNVALLTARCLARADAMLELDKAMKDCNRAVEYDIGGVPAMQARALVKLKMRQWDAAIADYTLALSYSDNGPRALYGRGLAKIGKGDKAGGEKDLAAARRYSFDTHVEFDAMGLTPEPRSTAAAGQ